MSLMVPNQAAWSAPCGARFSKEQKRTNEERRALALNACKTLRSLCGGASAKQQAARSTLAMPCNDVVYCRCNIYGS